MRNQRASLLLLLAVLLAGGILAYLALRPSPRVSDFYMATDKDGLNRSTVFSSGDDFYLFFDVSEIRPGTSFQSRWYGLDLQGQDPDKPLQTLSYTYQQGVNKVFFKLAALKSWPVGNYRVEVYMNGRKVGEQTFQVRSKE